MLRIRLPDGAVATFPEGITPQEIAQRLKMQGQTEYIAATLNGDVIDLHRPITRELLQQLEHQEEIPQLRWLSWQDAEALLVLRHSAAHIMARAVLRLFPGAKLAFGPATETGFYYDIDVQPAIREEDFPRIEAEMQRLIQQAEPFERFELPTNEARALCADLQQTYKVEHIDEQLRQFPRLSFYRQGEFIDLCRGPHVPHAGYIRAFKLLSIAGAYWKNDASRPQLQRLYGTAFFRQQDLDAFLQQLEEAKKRDHRILGKQLGIFTLSPMVGSGLVLWMPKGAVLRHILESFIREELVKRGYQPVYTPHLGRLELYRTSGHFPYYRDAQYPPLFVHPLGQTVDTWAELLANGRLTPPQEAAFLQLVRSFGLEFAAYERSENNSDRLRVLQEWLAEQEAYLVKPMNCPHHIQIYKAELRSYRDLPVRLAEFGTVYRYEQTGELAGMTRVRGFTQDDAHLFVTPEQVEPEMVSNLELVLFVLRSVGLSDYRVRVGLRDPASNKYVGKEENWNRAQSILLDIVKQLGMPYSAEIGEAAFYGPKIDFVVRDCLGREWQLGTVQLDYNLPERFDLEYVGKDNQRHRPIMIHRAPFGSFERFCGILIEHFAGAFPLWLAPEQARILPVSDRFQDYARQVESQLRQQGFRVSSDLRPVKIGAKIRDAQMEKIPYMLIVGEREQQAQGVALRDRFEGDLGLMPLPKVIERLRQEVQNKVIRRVAQSTGILSERGTRFET
uniref:Threonine--tRNA ligase n=1 Tax=uncultured Planctomycetota bacterium TaxID=120965 RepID=H5SCY3_9BACT|nr:threonyl-tRNA synthetase [uncultured Planctomycetota bacterium]